MDRWEYRSEGVIARVSKMVERLNELGREGWELVSVEGNYAFLKRRVT